MTKFGREIMEISEAFDLTGKSVRNYRAGRIWRQARPS